VSSTAGEAFTVTLTAQDAAGNALTGYHGTVHFTSSDPQAVLPADYTFVPADGGSHTFSVALKTAGAWAISAADTASSIRSGILGHSVQSGPTSRFAVVGFPSPVSPGSDGLFTVSAQDAYGNSTPEYQGTIHFTSSDPAALLPADFTFTAWDYGPVELSAV